MILVCGGFNAKIGNEQMTNNVAGRFSLHETTSENGAKLYDFATSNQLWIKGVNFLHKSIHKGTWKITGSHLCNQIDHVLVEKRHATSVEDVRTYRETNCDFDHYVVKGLTEEKMD
ncbi:uncharacterized protein LOC119688643 [Teleopsis dalmanni]|uniref:uncharacterized protein LOC119688643 n=1 Tax=Teleopsis dalmanni TaxID=139649 RepID=UPI0018CFCAB1|nr:uncharacterized protein LOC119688643 [Teleopsis dalmanni]